MKRTSRLLAILLSLCVLFAAVATFALAAETSPLDASQYGEGIKMVALNSEGLNSKYLGGNANASYNFESITGDGNTYTKLTRKPLTYAQMTASKMFEKPNREEQFANGFQGIGAGATATELKNFDYLVWSVDFMSEAVGENGKLNYLDESWFGTFGNAYYRYHIVKDADGDWFMSSDSEYSSDDAPLATEPGAWNNLTVVISRANGKQYGFANGRSFAAVSAPAALKIDRIVYNVWRSYDIYNTDWSISIDNVSFNSYATGYSSGNKYGLDDYFANADLTKYISDCEDVVYNSGYKLPSAPAVAEYTVTDDGVSKTYTSHSAVARLIPDLGAGDEIISEVKLDTLLDAAGRSYVKAETASHSIIYTITGAAPAASDDITKGTITFFNGGGTTSAFEYYYEEAPANLVTGTMVSKDFFGVRNGTAFTGNKSNTNYNFFLAPSGKTDKTSYPTSADYKYV
ncbi:MAG: hypothetical protein IIW21_08615, partial [Clostridia bacterium]|nr:hypothetical protein [Clostridia bacterium]